MGERQALGPPRATSAAMFVSTSEASPAPWRGPSIGSSASMMRRTASAGKRMGSEPSRRKRPIVELEHDMGLVALALAPRKVGARAVLGRDRAQSQRANIVAMRQRRGLDDFAPGEHSVAGEERRNMPAAVDRRDMEGIGEAVETEARASEMTCPP